MGMSGGRSVSTSVKSLHGDVAAVQSYLEKRVSEIKDFLAVVAKKLPVPCSFDVQRKFLVRKTIRLHFVCACRSPDCLYYGGDEVGDTFVIESPDWERWFKVAFCGAMVGEAVMTVDLGKLQAPGAVGEKAMQLAGHVKESGIVASCQAIYKAYTQEPDDAKFNVFTSEPFLTSSEQDHHLTNLRDRGFFTEFCYNA